MKLTKIVDRLFNFLVAIQTVLLFLFVLENIDDLDVIVFEFEGYDGFEVSFYDLLTLIAILFLAVIVSSFNILGTGLNEEGTLTFKKYMSFISLYIILIVGISYYLDSFSPVDTYILIFISIIYVMKAIEKVGE